MQLMTESFCCRRGSTRAQLFGRRSGRLARRRKRTVRVECKGGVGTVRLITVVIFVLRATFLECG